MKSLEDKLQDIRDSLDEVLIDSIENIDVIRKECPEDFDFHAELYEQYNDIRIAKNILDGKRR